MRRSKQSQLIEHLLLKNWQHRLVSYCAASSEGAVMVVLLLAAVIGVDFYAIKSFNSYMAGVSVSGDILLRSVGPLLFGMGVAVVWIFFMIVAKSNPPTGIIMLPFLPEDWRLALQRIIYYCSTIVLCLFLGPYLLVFSLHADLHLLGVIDFLILAILLIIAGGLVGSLAARLSGMMSMKLQTKYASMARYGRYIVFVLAQVTGIILFMKYVFLVPLTRQVSVWIPGTQLVSMHKELQAQHYMAATAYILLLLVILRAGLGLYDWLCRKAPEMYWFEDVTLRAKWVLHRPANLWRYRATALTSLRTIRRDAETVLMTLATLAIPIALGVLLRFSHHPELTSLYTQLVWILLPLAVANMALLSRSKLGATRHAIYNKPITPLIVVLSQVLAVELLSLAIGFAGLLICAKLAAIHIGITEILQFCFLIAGASLLALVVGSNLGDNHRGLTMLAAGTVYFISLIPFLAFNQWLMAKGVILQLTMSLVVLWAMVGAAFYSEQRKVAL